MSTNMRCPPRPPTNGLTIQALMLEERMPRHPHG